MKLFIAFTLALCVALPASAKPHRHKHRHARRTAATSAVAANHPRLLVTQADVATMRVWATAGNPWSTDIQQVLVPQVKTKIANGTLPTGDTGVGGLGSYAVENYAIILAFASL